MKKKITLSLNSKSIISPIEIMDSDVREVMATLEMKEVAERETFLFAEAIAMLIRASEKVPNSGLKAADAMTFLKKFFDGKIPVMNVIVENLVIIEQDTDSQNPLLLRKRAACLPAVPNAFGFFIWGQIITFLVAVLTVIDQRVALKLEHLDNVPLKTKREMLNEVIDIIERNFIDATYNIELDYYSDVFLKYVRK